MSNFRTTFLNIVAVLVLMGVVISTAFNINHEKSLNSDIETLKARQQRVLNTVSANREMLNDDKFNDVSAAVYKLCNRIHNLELTVDIKESEECRLRRLVNKNYDAMISPEYKDQQTLNKDTQLEDSP